MFNVLTLTDDGATEESDNTYRDAYQYIARVKEWLDAPYTITTNADDNGSVRVEFAGLLPITFVRRNRVDVHAALHAMNVRPDVVR